MHRQGEVHGNEEDLPQHPMHGHLPLSLPPPRTPTPPCSTHTPYIAQNLQRQRKTKIKESVIFFSLSSYYGKKKIICVYIYVKSQNKCTQTRDLGARSLLRTGLMMDPRVETGCDPSGTACFEVVSLTRNRKGRVFKNLFVC